MLYYLFEYLNAMDFPGAGAMQYISTRAALAIIVSLIISMMLGDKLIAMLHRKQVGETVRDLGLKGQIEKQGTPTMGGLIILAAILIPTLLFAKLENTYIILMLVSTVWLGMIGFIDDYIKVFKKNKEGLAGKFKVVGQLGIGIIAGSVLYFADDVVVGEKVQAEGDPTYTSQTINLGDEQVTEETYHWEKRKSTTTTIPFVKNNEFNYAWLTNWMGDAAKWVAPIIFILIVVVIVIAVSNGANMTDGLDGLATGTSAIIGVTLAVLAYVSGNTVFAAVTGVSIASAAAFSRIAYPEMKKVGYKQSFLTATRKYRQTHTHSFSW